MKLWWIRHAQAKAGAIDARRNLTDYGKIQAQKLAEFIHSESEKPAQIFASPYNRAQQTAFIIGDKIGLGVQTLEKITPNDLFTYALEYLQNIDKNTLIVTHQPLWSRVFKQLMQEQNYLNVPTATMAILQGEIFIPGALSLERIIEG